MKFHFRLERRYNMSLQMDCSDDDENVVFKIPKGNSESERIPLHLGSRSAERLYLSSSFMMNSITLARKTQQCSTIPGLPSASDSLFNVDPYDVDMIRNYNIPFEPSDEDELLNLPWSTLAATEDVLTSHIIKNDVQKVMEYFNTSKCIYFHTFLYLCAFTSKSTMHAPT